MLFFCEDTSDKEEQEWEQLAVTNLDPLGQKTDANYTKSWTIDS